MSRLSTTQILQNTKNYTVYPTVPLALTLPAVTTANDLLVCLVFAQRSSYGFNTDNLTAETVAPVVSDDKNNTWTLRQSLINLYQELSASPPQSPPVISPDASWNFPSVYLFTAPVSVANGQNVYVTDAGLGDYVASPPIVSPPIALGRPVFDGGIKALLFEVQGPSTDTVDTSGKTTGGQTALGYHLITPGGTNRLVIEAGVLIDSSALGLGTGATYQHSAAYPAGSSYYLVQSTTQTTAVASAGFSNPVNYAGGVIAIAIV